MKDKNVSKLSVSKVGVLGSILSVVLIASSVLGTSYVYKNELNEKEELIDVIEKENGVLMSKDSVDRKDIDVADLKTMLNKEAIIYPIKYNNEDYYFYIDTITKKSVDISKDYKYELTVKAQILKDKNEGFGSFLKEVIPGMLNQLIEEKNEKLKVNGVNDKNIVPGVDFIDNNEVDNMNRELIQQLEVANKEVNLSFNFGSKGILEQTDIVSMFVEEVIFKDKKFNSLNVTENEKSIVVNVDSNVYEFNKGTSELK